MIFIKKTYDFVKLLNKIHNQNLNVKFWKFFGPWFQKFIFVIHDRWERLLSFKK